MPHNPAEPETKRASDAMIVETLAQYRAILDTGLVVEFNDGEDPHGKGYDRVNFGADIMVALKEPALSKSGIDNGGGFGPSKSDISKSAERAPPNRVAGVQGLVRQQQLRQPRSRSNI